MGHKKTLKTFLKDRRGVTGAEMAILVIALFIGTLLAGAILPTAFSQIFNADTTNWTTSTVTVFQLLPLVVSIALVVYIVFLAVKQ